MSPVDQDIFHDPAHPTVQGNCLQAVIASLLDLPLADVPHFVQDDEDTGGKRNWWNALIEFLAERGRVLRLADPLAAGDDYLMVSGRSPRGVHHVVIYRDGEMVHDPHPDRSGLLSVSLAWELRNAEVSR